MHETKWASRCHGYNYFVTKKEIYVELFIMLDISLLWSPCLLCNRFLGKHFSIAKERLLCVSSVNSKLVECICYVLLLWIFFWYFVKWREVFNEVLFDRKRTKQVLHVLYNLQLVGIAYIHNQWAASCTWPKIFPLIAGHKLQQCIYAKWCFQAMYICWRTAA